MFTAEDRERLTGRARLGRRADTRISSTALLGSSALGREDRWSDIDLALRLASDADRTPAIAEWTDRMYGEQAAVHHLDVTRGETLYRVSCSPARCRSISPSGPRQSSARSDRTSACCSEPPPNRSPQLPAAVELVGMGWRLWPARPLEHRARPGVAGGVHDHARPGARPSLQILACQRPSCLLTIIGYSARLSRTHGKHGRFLHGMREHEQPEAD